MAVDTFSISWTKQYVYIFAPFSTFSMVLQKIVEDKTEALVVAPLWTTRSWWPQLCPFKLCNHLEQTRAQKSPP